MTLSVAVLILKTCPYIAFNMLNGTTYKVNPSKGLINNKHLNPLLPRTRYLVLEI